MQATSDISATSAGWEAGDHGTRLLTALGLPLGVTTAADHPALAWRRSGLMAVTGDGSGLVSPVPLTLVADGALAALRTLAPDADLPASGASLLGERARLLGLTRKGAISPNGSCRLLATRDGGIALNVPRTDDWDLLPALFQSEVTAWADVARHAAMADTDELVARGRLLGLAIAADLEAPVPATPFDIAQLAPPRPAAGPPLVVDLASLWAGPLTGMLLQACGANVVKVESRTRLDGARGGNADFYALLNAGKRSVALDFSDGNDLQALRALVRRADIIIEGSRPRALRQLGIDATTEAARGATWISITAHGRDGPAAAWIGFGDDAAVAGGLSAAMQRAWGEPLFAGDAIADPLAGITAALAGWASWRRGGGRMISVPMAQVIAHACGPQQAGGDLGQWQALAQTDIAPLYPIREPIGTVAFPGEHNAIMLGG